MNSKKNLFITIISIAVMVIMLVISGWIFVSNNKELNDLQAQSDTNEKTISQLKAELKTPETSKPVKTTAPTAATEAVTTTENAEPMLNAAAEAGNEVAAIQTGYEEWKKDPTANQRESYTDKLTKFFDGSDSYVWYDVPFDLVRYHWVFNTTYAFNKDRIPVMWTCYDDNNIPLAYTTATYDANDGKFHVVEMVRTSEGQDHYNRFTDPDYYGGDIDTTLDKDSKDEMDWLIGIADGIDDSSDTDTNDDDYDELYEPIPG